MSTQGEPDVLAPALDAFFVSTEAYLGGRISIAEWGDKLGPSASPPSRADFYRRLMSANVRRILRALFPAVAKVFDEPARAGIATLPKWDALCADFIATAPSQHWSPNALGDAFPDFLAGRADLPPGLAPVAGWSRQLLRAGLEMEAPPKSTMPYVLAPGVSAAAYPFDVAAWMRHFDAGPAVLEDAPQGPPVVLVAYRDPETLRARVLRPSATELAVLACYAGEMPQPIQGSTEFDAFVAARMSLISRGLLRPTDGAESEVKR